MQIVNTLVTVFHIYKWCKCEKTIIFSLLNVFWWETVGLDPDTKIIIEQFTIITFTWNEVNIDEKVDDMIIIVLIFFRLPFLGHFDYILKSTGV